MEGMVMGKFFKKWIGKMPVGGPKADFTCSPERISRKEF